MLVNRLVLKLGLVRFATSLMFIVLATVLNRVLVVELLVPAALVTFSFAFQHVMTPVGLITGYFSDAYAPTGRHRAPYIWGGMLLSLAVMPLFPSWALALGASPHNRQLLWQGVALFSLFGVGTTMSATAINALLVDRIPKKDRGSAMTLLWILTLGGFIFGSVLISFLYPEFDPAALTQVFILVTVLALVLTIWGAWGVEPRRRVVPTFLARQLDFWLTIRFLGSNLQSLAFFLFLMATIFFLAIQTFLLTPFGGEVLGLPMATTSQFGIYLTYGILTAMLGLHLFLGDRARRFYKAILAVGLSVGTLAFVLLSLTSFTPNPVWGLYALGLLGLSRGLYNVGLSHLTMGMTHPLFSGIFMGLWNLMSGLALAAGEMTGGALKDWLTELTGSVAGAYGWLFLLEGLGLFSCLVLLLPLNQKTYREALEQFLIETRRRRKPSLAVEAGGISHDS
jgi:BCD family chlorophyll transporter-like MFS transporter